MTESEKYFLGLVSSGRIQIDYKTGIVYSLASGKPKKVGAKNSAGYLHMSSGPSRQERHYILLHRLVWMSINGDIPDKYQINHKNGKKHDNRLENLEVVTRGENAIHAHNILGKVFGLFGRNNSGENHPQAILTKSDVDKMRALWKTGKYTKVKLANMFGVKKSQASNIILGKSWKS